MARRNKSSLVTEVFKDNTTKQYVIKRIGNIVRKELFTMCSEKTGSILSSKHVSDLKEFTWDKLLTELDSHAPVLHSILKMCTQTRRRTSPQPWCSNWDVCCDSSTISAREDELGSKNCVCDSLCRRLLKTSNKNHYINAF